MRDRKVGTLQQAGRSFRSGWTSAASCTLGAERGLLTRARGRRRIVGRDRGPTGEDDISWEEETKNRDDLARWVRPADLPTLLARVTTRSSVFSRHRSR